MKWSLCARTLLQQWVVRGARPLRPAKCPQQQNSWDLRRLPPAPKWVCPHLNNSVFLKRSKKFACATKTDDFFFAMKLTSSKLHQILTLDYYSREEDDHHHHVVVPVIIVLICSRIPIVSTDLLNML